MTRQINKTAEDEIKSFERCLLRSYRDQGGVPTIGWGHTGPEVAVGQSMTQQEADDMFIRDMRFAEQCVGDNTTVPLGDNQFGALVSFTFNCGVQAFASSSLLKALNAGNYNAVPAQMALWNKVKDRSTGQLVVSNGLINRRAADIQVWSTSDTLDPMPVSITPAAPPQGVGASILSFSWVHSILAFFGMK